MDRIDAMRVFARVVERGSFIRAAEDLGLPASTATDAVKQLEARLDVRLLQRTTRQVRATLDGEAYYRRCLAILDDIDETEGAFSGARPRGLLRVDVHRAGAAQCNSAAELGARQPKHVAQHPEQRRVPIDISLVLRSIDFDANGHAGCSSIYACHSSTSPFPFEV